MSQPTGDSGKPSPGRAAGAGSNAGASTRLASGAGLVLLGRVGGRMVHLVIQVVLARWMGPATYGLYALSWTLLRMLGVVGVLGLDSAVVRFGARAVHGEPARLKGTILHGLGWATAAGSALALLFAVSAPWLADSVFAKPDLMPFLWAVAPGFVFFALMQVASAATRASQRMLPTVVTRDLGQPLVHLVLIGVAISLDLAAVWAVYAAVAGLALAGAAALGFVVATYPTLRSADVRAESPGAELLRFGLPAMLGGVFTMYLVWLDRVMVGAMRPEADVGIYQAASQIAILFPVILTALGTAFAPMAARLHADGDLGQLGALFRLCTRWGVRLGVPLLLVACLFPGDVLEALFGDPFRAGASALVVLTVGQFVNLATGPINAVFMMTGLERRWLLISAGALAVDAVLNWILIPRWGIVGAAVATAVSIVLVFAVGLGQLWARLGVTLYVRRFLPILGAAALGTVAATPVLLWASGPPALRALFALGSVTAVFTLASAKLGMDDEERSFIEGVWQRLRAGARTT